MNRRRAALAVACAAGISVGLETSIGAADSGENYTINGGAEDGTSGWGTTGWQTQRYDSFPTLSPGYSGNNWLFTASSSEATLTQVNTVSDAAGEIDAGHRPLYISAQLGATGDGPAGAEVLAEPLDSSGMPLGIPTQIGPPTVADRGGETAMINCVRNIDTPAGTRAIKVSVTVSGPVDTTHLGLADNVAVSWSYVIPASLPAPTPAEGPGCYLYPKTPTPTPTPTPSPAPTSSASPTATVAPTATASPTASPTVTVSHVRLTHRRLTFRVSTPSRVRVRIARRGRVVRKYALTLARRSSRHFSRLPKGRYRVTIEPLGGYDPPLIVHRRLR
jgi:hypothetical protein